jgi:NADPH-dependent ferric siderophore reductase
MGLVDSIAKRFATEAILIDKKQIAEHTFHLTIQGEALKSLRYTPGEHLRILVGVDRDTSMQNKVRTYSVWRYDSTNGLMDLAVCTHSSGIGSRWVQELAIDSTIYFTGPKGKFTIDPSGDYYVFVGDMSALAHLYEINRHLPASKPVISLVYADQEVDFFPDLTGNKPFSFYQLPQNPASTIIEQLDSLTKKQPGNGMLYVGGDSRICVTLNHHFRRSLGWKNGQIKSKPFWNPLRTGLE